MTVTRTRVTAVQLQQLANQLSARYTVPLEHLARARILTGHHLDQLLAKPNISEETTARVRRRIMTRLHDLGLIDTLERRIGGVRAGSAGHIHTLTTAGHRFLALTNGEQSPPRIRHSRTPGTLFLNHALAISDIYVHLIQATRTSSFQVATFTTEPDSWWLRGDGTYLRPDAYTVLQTPTHQDCWWLEIDQATESIRRIQAKCRTYLDFLASGGPGPDDVPPRVLFIAPNLRRVEAIREAIIKLVTPDTDLITPVLHQDAVCVMVTELHAP